MQSEVAVSSDLSCASPSETKAARVSGHLIFLNNFVEIWSSLTTAMVELGLRRCSIMMSNGGNVKMSVTRKQKLPAQHD